MNADPTTLRKSHGLFRQTVMSVFTHDLPTPAPFRQASRDLEDAFQTALELVPNHLLFPVHMFRILVRLRRTIRRWTAMIPRVVRIQPIPGIKPFPPQIHCPTPWTRKPQNSTMSPRSEAKAEPGSAEHQLGNSTTTDAPLQNAAQRAATLPADNSQLPAHPHHAAPTTHHAMRSIASALQHERRQAWKHQIDLPHIHPINPLAPDRPKRQGDSAHPANAPRPRPWPGWRELPGPAPKPYNPATEQTEDLSHPFHQALCDTGNPTSTQPGNAEPQLGKSIPSTTFTMSRRSETKADPFTKFTSSTHHASRTTHHPSQSDADFPPLLDSPLSYQRHLDHVLLQIVTTLVRAYAKTQRLANRTDDWTPMPRFESTSNLPTQEQIEPHKHSPAYLNSQAFFEEFRNDLEKLLRKRLEAIWFHAHHPLDGPPIEPNPKHLAKWTGQKPQTTTTPNRIEPHPSVPP